MPKTPEGVWTGGDDGAGDGRTLVGGVAVARKGSAWRARTGAGGCERETGPDAGDAHHGVGRIDGVMNSRRGALGRQALDKAQRLGAVGAAWRGVGMDGEAARNVIG